MWHSLCAFSEAVAMNRMGKKLFIIFTMLFCVYSFGYAQSDIVNEAKDAIKAGSSKELAAYLNSSIDITINGDMGNYSRTQGEYILRDFFKDNPPSSFTIVHQGASKGGLPYAIGQYLSKEKTFRVWMRIKNSGNDYLIHEISFIEE
jgi:hypothetical protein